jgi:pentatricopeptide repeat protein
MDNTAYKNITNAAANFGNSKMFADAKVLYQLALKYEPTYTSALRGLAWSYWNTGDIHVAIALYEKAIAQEPDPITNKDAYTSLVTIYNRLGDFDKAKYYQDKMAKTE